MFPLPSFLVRSVVLTVMAAVLFCPSARGDVVAARGQKPLVNTQVVRLENGKLICRDETGGEIGFAVEQVDYLQITGWQMLNLAEKQRRAEDWRQAAVSYEKALADLQLEPGAGEPRVLDRVLLVKCRLISAWDAQGQFERAVELYLDAIEAMPELLDPLRPTRFPETGSAVLETVARQVDGVIQRHGDDTVARSLRNWRATWPVRPAASAPDSREATPQLGRGPDEFPREEIKRVGTLVESGRSDDAIAVIRSLQPKASGELRADLYYWQGRALEAALGREVAARPDESASARAGLAYMRVVVHFPRHPLAAESLYRAGDLARRAGRREQAASLWSELISHYPQARSPEGNLWADRAREGLK